MKKQKLEKILKEKGARLLRQGSNHEFWISKNGFRFPVPRYNEIKEDTARGIIKQADQ